MHNILGSRNNWLHGGLHSLSTYHKLQFSLVGQLLDESSIDGPWSTCDHSGHGRPGHEKLEQFKTQNEGRTYKVFISMFC